MPLRHSSRLTSCVLVILAPCALSCGRESAEVSLAAESLVTLQELSDALVERQIQDPQSPDFGAIDCPETGVKHTRAAEAVYPLAVLYKHTGEERYLRAAVDTGDWLIRQQRPKGQWLETPWRWPGTTVNQLLMLTLAYPILEQHMDEEQRSVWTESMRRAADYLVRVMDPGFASINFSPTTAAALMTTHGLLPDERYAAKARELARWTVAKMDEDGFLAGEGARAHGVKYGVDLGYQMDMSLWGLGLYARLAGDDLVDDHVRRSLANHLFFVYPDGLLDGSWAARAYKWTTYGTKSADGSQITFALYTGEDDRYRTAALRNLEYLRTMVRDGLVGYGPHFWDLTQLGLPCIYPTFTRAKNLALAIELGDPRPGPTPALPADETGWLRLFPTLDVAIVRTASLMATGSAYGFERTEDSPVNRRSRYFPSGGCLTNLWFEGHGLLQTSSQTRYFRAEEIHMPELDQEVRALTPRIEYVDRRGYFTNLYERHARLKTRREGREFVFAAAGELSDEHQLPGGVAYALEHRFDDQGVTKTVSVRYHDRNPQVRIVEPIVQHPGMSFRQIDDRTVLIEGGGREFRFELLQGEARIILGEEADAYWFPLPAIRAYPIVLELPRLEERHASGRFEDQVIYRLSLE